MSYERKLRFLERLLGKARYSSNTNEAEFFCCFCTHHKPKLSINLESDRWKCWVCGKNGKALFYVLKKVGSSEDINEYIKHHKSKLIDSPRPDFIDQGFRISLPEDYYPLVDCIDTPSGKRAWNYLHKRGISGDQILKYKIGICDRGILLPSFDKKGYLNFYQIRQYSKDFPYYVPQEVPKGYKNQIIINELNIDWEKPVVLVEGFFDMLKSTTNTVPLLTSSLIKDSKLFETIVIKAKKVYLALDPDAERNIRKVANRLTSYGIHVYKINVSPYKDIGEMTKKEFIDRYKNAIFYDKRSIFKERLATL